ncbi:pyridoxamine 5'-phosphate oxidase family protein [Schumannella luteola]
MPFMPLPESESWKLLASTTIGRLAVSTPEGADVFPLTHHVHERAIYFRTAPGTKLAAIAENPRIAFETDGFIDTRPWSVVVRGIAHRLDEDDEIITSGVLDVITPVGGEKWNYVRITPVAVTGRRG